MKRIDNKNNRLTTFSKRRSGLMKKARELSVLCDVDLALIVFSARGRLYEFCSGNSLRKIIEWYLQIRCDAGANVGSSSREAEKRLMMESLACLQERITEARIRDALQHEDMDMEQPVHDQNVLLQFL